MASDVNEETLDELDSATVPPVQSEPMKSNSAECMAVASSSVLSLVKPAYIDSYNGGSRNEKNINVGQEFNMYGSKPTFTSNVNYNRETNQDLEQLKRDNREFKAMKKCYCCKDNDFSFVLTCSHIVCKSCAERRMFCECKQRIILPYASILASGKEVKQRRWTV